MIILIGLIFIHITNAATPQLKTQQLSDHSADSDLIATSQLLQQQQFASSFTPSNQKPSNFTCLFNVSQSGLANFRSVAEALNQTCNETDGYEINLLDSEHIESLEINKNSSIIIKGNNKVQTIWHLDSPHRQLINLNFGNLTLENIDFQFVVLSKWYSMIQPSYYLISVGSDPFNSPQLTIKLCKFHSLSHSYKYLIHQIRIRCVDNLQIIDTVFSGIGTEEVSYISLLQVNSFKNLYLKNCTFQNASINTTTEPVFLNGIDEVISASILDCQFINITTNNENCHSALALFCIRNIKTIITGNKFTNCKSVNSGSGALSIYDYEFENQPDEFVINNNTFTNNTGINSGAIFFLTINNQSKYSFNFNTFVSNRNNQTDMHGQDVFLIIYDPPLSWTIDNITVIMSSIFNGSVSDALNNSVFFKVRLYNYTDYSGGIILHYQPAPQPQKKRMSAWAVIGIIVFSVLVLINVLLVVVTIGLVLKNRQKYEGNIAEHSPLLINSQFQSQ
ncbi:MAG: hypothetical protein EZS28_006724 [Streblomastix strix]|uniref:Right handed beta helix domain-containing protein n=1 Tax=Streblomastix strix TaxID=222440 RepID=A0A5J4WT87_9EUKA|nr:MAG: hypothetical protein EZS28_006724 [Streblomastix strix]